MIEAWLYRLVAGTGAGMAALAYTGEPFGAWCVGVAVLYGLAALKGGRE